MGAIAPDLFAKSRLAVLLPAALLAAGGCGGERRYPTFADYPGFDRHYAGLCRGEDPGPPPEEDRELLRRHRPRLVFPPGGRLPVDFYRDYLPRTTLRSFPGGEVLAREVTPDLLRRHADGRESYLDFDLERHLREGGDRRAGDAPPEPGGSRPKPAVYGRVYRERVAFPAAGGAERSFDLTFLKYNAVFAVSGLAADLPRLHRLILLLPGLDAEDWHELDNFVAVHVVLDEGGEPFAVMLAQHNHHRTYLLGRDMDLPADGRLAFDVAVRSNEVYPASPSPVPQRHRVVQWSLYLDYLLSGEDPPFFHASDVTVGAAAGGREVGYDLRFLSPCDPLYRAGMLLGEPRPLLGRYVGRDGPPGSDYYAVPELLPLGRLLQAGYLRDGDPEDIRAVRSAVDRRRRTVDAERLVRHGGRRLLEDWQGLRGGFLESAPAAVVSK